jgi:hypothetical protein
MNKKNDNSKQFMIFLVLWLKIVQVSGKITFEYVVCAASKLKLDDICD